RASQVTYAELTESPDYKLRIRISELVELVKKAFKEKRRQDCTAIAKTILELDAQNDDARFILSWIECDLERDLQLARALLPDLKNDERLYKNAQVIVQTVLETDPGNKAAEALRLEIESAFQSFESDQANLLPDPTIDEIANVAAVIDAAADASLDALD